MNPEIQKESPRTLILSKLNLNESSSHSQFNNSMSNISSPTISNNQQQYLPSNNKRNKKLARKENESSPAPITFQPNTSASQDTSNNDGKQVGLKRAGLKDQEKEFLKSKAKFAHMDSACSWFANRRKDMEKSKKGGMQGIPLNHKYKAPRIDQDKYQVDQNSIPQLRQCDQDKRAEVNNQESTSIRQSQNLLGVKRRRRAYSFGEQQTSDKGSQCGQFDPYQAKVIIASTQSIDQKQAQPIFKVNYQQTQQQQIHQYEPTSTLLHSQIPPTPLNDQQLDDYFDLVEFIMTQANSNCNGLWLKGSQSYKERAHALLHKYNYDIRMAKFHILYPTVMMVPQMKQEVLGSMTIEDIDSIINDALIDLRGCKTKEAEEALEEIRSALSSRITLDDYTYYQQKLNKMRIEIPSDIEQEVQRSKDFSKVIRRKCLQVGGGTGLQGEKKLKYNEIVELNDESQKYFIITADMLQLGDYMRKAQQWLDKAISIKDQVINIKVLQNTVQEAKNIPVNFESTLEQLKRRYHDSQNLIEKIHQTFIKVNKTRTQIGAIQKEKKHKKQLDTHSGAKKRKEELFQSLIKEADQLKITNQEIQKLKQHMEEVEQWKNRARMFLEDDLHQHHRKEIFSQLVKETQLFKYEVDLTKDLQRRCEFIEWKEKIIKVHRMLKQRNEEVTLKLVEGLMKECSNKVFQQVELPEYAEIKAMYRDVKEYEQEVEGVLYKIFESGDEKKHNIDLADLIKLKEKGEELVIIVPQLGDLKSKLDEITSYVTQCNQFLKQGFPSEPITQTLLEEILELRKQVQQLGVKNEILEEFLAKVKPLLIWIKYARKLIKGYYKSIDVQLNQQVLVEQQEYTSSSENDEEVKMNIDIDEEQDQDMEDTNKEQLILSNKQIHSYDLPHSHHDLLQFLLSEAQKSHPILKTTRDFTLLTMIQDKVDQWIESTSKIQEQDIERVNENVEVLEGLLTNNLPIPQHLQQDIQKRLRREKWIKRLNELRQSDKVRINKVETLVKDSMHHDIQSNLQCKALADVLREDMEECKKWLVKHQEFDSTNQDEIEALLKEGAQLKINLQDYVEVRNYYDEFLEWKQISGQILNQWKDPQFTLDTVIKHIQEGEKRLDIEEQELFLLKQMVQVTQQWKAMVRKVLTCREVVYYGIPQENEDDQYSIILNKPNQGSPNYSLYKSKEEEKQRYCICRQGDDGNYFMICCDICGEWFHGLCVGITPNYNNLYQQYICIGCARIQYNFDPYEATIQIVDDEEKQAQFQPEVYEKFYQKKRPEEKVFEKLLYDGESLIPLYLEEMPQLKRISQLMGNWVWRVNYELGNGIDCKAIEKGEEDLRYSALLQLFLESESFPVDTEQAHSLLLLIKQREWYKHCHKLIETIKNQNGHKINKGQLKRKIKQLLLQKGELSLESNFILQEMCGYLQNIQFTQEGIYIAQSTLHKSTNQSYYEEEDEDSFSQVMYQIEELLKTGGEYSEYIQLVEDYNQLCMQSGSQQSNENREKIEDIKTILSDYSKWLSNAREYLNENSIESMKEFERIMREGEQVFWMIDSVEKKNYQAIMNNEFITNKEVSQIDGSLLYNCSPEMQVEDQEEDSNQQLFSQGGRSLF